MAKIKEKRDYSVYVHTIKENGKKYVGITNRKDVKRRWEKEGKGYKRQPFYYAIKKYGWGNIEHEILYTGLTREEAIQWEMALIALWKTENLDCGYNRTSGGEAIPPYGRKLSEQYKQLLRERFTGAKNFKARKVINLESLKVYDCISDAARENNLTSNGIVKCCKFERRHYKNTYWAYFDDNNTIDYYSELYNIIRNKKNKERVLTDKFKRKQAEVHSKKVICLETLEIFNSSVEAQRKYHCTSVGQCCNHKGYTAGGYHWEFYEEDKTMEYYKNLELRKPPKPIYKYKESPHRKAVIALETLTVYPCMYDAEKATNAKHTNIIKCCNLKRNKAGGFHWRYYDSSKPMSYYQDIPLIDEPPRHDTRNKKVLQIETNTVYKSADEATRSLGKSPCGNISKCCRGLLKTAYGYHWRYVN